LGIKDFEEFNRIIKGKCDWFQYTIVTIREWKNCMVFNRQVYSSTPIMAVFPILGEDLWSVKALSAVSSMLGKSIEMQRLGRLDNIPSTMVGGMVS